MGIPQFIIGGVPHYEKDDNVIIITDSTYNHDIHIPFASIRISEISFKTKEYVSYLVIPYNDHNDDRMECTWIVSNKTHSKFVSIILSIHFESTSSQSYSFRYNGGTFSLTQDDNVICDISCDEISNDDIKPVVCNDIIGIKCVTYRLHDIYVWYESIIATQKVAQRIVSLFQDMKDRLRIRKWKVCGSRIVFSDVICNGYHADFLKIDYTDIDAYTVSSNGRMMITTQNNKMYDIDLQSSEAYHVDDLRIDLRQLLSQE